MSAIFGLLHGDGKPVDPDHLERMNLTLAPHGPDNHGVTIQGHVGLGYRLRRFTPEDHCEAQPLSDEGVVWLVSDARIDNRTELAETLGISSPEASAMPDSAYILRAWRRWGPECVVHLIGAYCFAIYNSRDETLFLARSPRGERSLHYLARADIFAFATAPKGLFALPFVERRIDRNSLADYLVLKQAPEGSTFYAGIKSLAPGHTMLVRRDSMETHRFWSVGALRQTRFRRDEEYVEAFCVLFDRVVQDHLRSASPVGIMLSGGLDSTSVAASAALALDKAGKRLHAFTEVPEQTTAIPAVKGRYSDETSFVDAMARCYPNIQTNYIRTPGGFFLQGIERFFEAAEVPFRNASNRVWWEAIQEQAGNRNIKVVLTGQSGNLTISWNGSQLLHQLIAQGSWYRAFGEARWMRRAGRTSSAIKALSMAAVLHRLPDSLWIRLNRLKHPSDSIFSSKTPWEAYSPISHEFFSDCEVEKRARMQGHNWQFRSSTSSRAQTTERHSLGAEIKRGHEAMFGVQLRDPTSDQRIVEFCLSIPEDQFLRHGTDRWLIRRALKNRAPAEILQNPRRGLQAADWLVRLKNARSEVLEELDLLESCELARYAIDLRGIRRFTENTATGALQGGVESLRLRTKIEAGLMTGRFLRWIESGA